MNRQQLGGAVGMGVVGADHDIIVAEFADDVRDIVRGFAGDVNAILF